MYGLLSAPISELIGTPINTISTEMQKSQIKISVSSTITKIYMRNGIKSFYNSYLPMTFLQMGASSIKFGVYYNMKDKIGKIGSGVLTATLIPIITNPLVFINTKLQTGDKPDISKIYRGFSCNMCRSMVIIGIQMPIYDYLRENNFSEFITPVLTTAVTAYAGSPLTVIRTRLMTSEHKSTILQLTKDIWKYEGFTGFFKGVTTQFVRYTPQFFISTYIYTLLSKQYYNY